MKNIKISYLIFSIAAFLFAGCGSYKTLTGTINFDASSLNEGVKTSELSNSLKDKSSLKFLIRTPVNYDKLEGDELAEMNSLVAEIEKDLIREGQRVKDMKLVDYLTDRGALNSENYNETLDADIIIEIMDVQFDIPNQITEFNIQEMNKKANFNDWENLKNIDCQLAMLACRVILVKEGNVGGIFKFYVSGCDEINNFYITLYQRYDGTINTDKDVGVGWNYGNTSYLSLVHSYDLSESSREIAIKKLVGALLAQLIQK